MTKPNPLTVTLEVSGIMQGGTRRNWGGTFMRIRTLLHAVLVVVILALCGKIVSTWRRPLPTPSGEAPNASTLSSGTRRASHGTYT